MDLNTIFNGILAVIAIVGFLISLYFSRQTLKQAKELNDKAVNAELFEKRYEVIEFFEKFIDADITPKYEDADKLPKYFTMMDLLFKNTNRFRLVLVDLSNYLESYKIDILKQRINSATSNPSEIKLQEIKPRFYTCYRIYLQDLKNELGIIDLKREIGIF